MDHKHLIPLVLAPVDGFITLNIFEAIYSIVVMSKCVKIFVSCSLGHYFYFEKHLILYNQNKCVSIMLLHSTW